MAKMKKSSDKKIKKEFCQNGVVHIKSSFNNTIVTISDVSGNADGHLVALWVLEVQKNLHLM